MLSCIQNLELSYNLHGTSFIFLIYTVWSCYNVLLRPIKYSHKNVEGCHTKLGLKKISIHTVFKFTKLFVWTLGIYHVALLLEYETLTYHIKSWFYCTWIIISFWCPHQMSNQLYTKTSSPTCFNSH